MRIATLTLFLFTSVCLFGIETSWEKRIYLASTPRSGNHWMRALIEEATHIATSSVYCDSDPQHLSKPFPWGGYCPKNGYEGTARYPYADELFVVKTHFPYYRANSFDSRPYVRTIRILRHPVDAFFSYYLYSYATGILEFQKRPIQYTLPTDLLNEYIRNWRMFQDYWDQADNVVTIYYEDMYEQPGYWLRVALDAIGYAYSDEDIDRAVARHPPKGSLMKHLDHYTESSLQIIERELGPYMIKYGYQIPIKG